MPTEAEIQDASDRAVEAFLNRPRRRPTSPSPRQPEFSRYFNHADLIERQLQEDNHRTWGFVIYRTMYNSDEDWAEFLKRLRFRMEENFDIFNGRDILELFTLTIMEDRGHLDGASTATVREHFRQWCMTAPQSEQQQQGITGGEIGPGLSPRYRYAVQVGAASLHSVVYDAPAPPTIDASKKGWVKLIDASWQPMSPERERMWGLYEPIEGVTEKNIGWIKVPYQDVMDGSYSELRDLNSWVTSYRRPPAVVG